MAYKNMKLEDIAKQTINEVAAELQKTAAAKATAQAAQTAGATITAHTATKPTQTSEVVFLQNVKERLCVLFEGLNKNDSNDKRLEITIKFLEFLLASIDTRLNQCQSPK